MGTGGMVGGGDLRMCGVEFDERSTDTTDGDGECELGMVAMGGGGEWLSKCLRGEDDISSAPLSALEDDGTSGSRSAGSITASARSRSSLLFLPG
jgi:hypothetical protein